jgi:hypothetical protein
MTVESAAFITDLNSSYPPGSDFLSEGDDHLRLLKSVLKNQFTSLGAQAVTVSADDLNGAITYGAAAGLSSDIDFIDHTKGLQWTLPSADTVRINAGEKTIDSQDYQYLEFSMAGLVVNAGGVADDAGFVACVVDQTISVTVPAFVGFNDKTTYEYLAGILYNPDTDELIVGDNDAPSNTCADVILQAANPSVRVKLSELVLIVEAMRGGAVGETLTLTKDSSNDFDFTGSWA